MIQVFIRQAFALAVFCFVTVFAASAQDRGQTNKVVMNLIMASVLNHPSEAPAIHKSNSTTTSKSPYGEYVDAEHAFYRAPLRTSTVYADYKTEATQDDYYLVIEKSKYSLSVYGSNDELLAIYPIVLGSNDAGDKMCEGDRQTPEGEFKIVSKKKHNQWNKYLALNYPTEESYEKYNKRKQQGLIPSKAGIGGGIGLHGTWAKDDIAVDRRDNWTSGCVSTKNAYIDELYLYIPVGTKVIIRK